MSGLTPANGFSFVNLNKTETKKDNILKVPEIDMQKAKEDFNKKNNVSEDRMSVKYNQKSANIAYFVEGAKNWENDTTREKYITVFKVQNADKPMIRSIHKIELEQGSTEIKYRFKADTDKCTFADVNMSPKEYGKNKDFYYVNGINTKKEESEKTASEISKLSGQNVKAIYNQTNGMLSDLLEAAGERFSDKKFDSISEEAASNFFNTLSSGKDLKIVAHSQGAAITSDALKLCEKMLVSNKIFELKKENPNWTYMQADSEAKKQVSKTMSNVEVITMGGAASQDKFPNVKLVEVVNPKDVVPEIVGTDKMEIMFSRKVVSNASGKVSYVANPKEVADSHTIINPNLQHVVTSVRHLPGSLSFTVGSLVTTKNPIDYHKVDEGKDAYLNQINVRSLLYNFGRQDFQMLK